VCVVGVLAAAASWWGVGDQSEARDAYNRMIDPPRLAASTETTLGSAAATALVAVIVVMAVSTWRRRLDPSWWGVVAPVILLGIYAGWSYRIVTAAVHGANIGGGMVMIATPFVCVVLGGRSVTSWRRIRGRSGSSSQQ
jgi:hypothetical protein